MKRSIVCAGFLTAFVATVADAQQTVSLKSADGLEITGELYLANKAPATPFVVLFHQAGWSRGEYREIAPKLNALGFNCLAIDQRSGKVVNDVENQTAKRARAAGKGTNYVDALPDLVAALTHVRKQHPKAKVIAWGSSYSSALVLKLAGDRPDLVDGALAFAPGEYFARLGKSKTWIRASAKNITKPVFITSARDEERNWRAIYDVIPSKAKARYLPETKGNHGSRALWTRFPDNAGYWTAVQAFLRSNFLK